MSSQNLNPNHDDNEFWFAKFFIGSMVSIAALTLILSFLPSPSPIRSQPQNKPSILQVLPSNVPDLLKSK